MSTQPVIDAIVHCRAVIDEWPEAANCWEMAWREVDTRYAFIDPVLRGLGWNISDPKECVPELRRGSGWLDYGLFDRNGRAIILEGGAPIIAVEAKSLWGHWHHSLEEHEGQLEYYIAAEPPMECGLAVLTNRGDWQLYDIRKGGQFADKLVATVDITAGSVAGGAQVLHEWLSRERWW